MKTHKDECWQVTSIEVSQKSGDESFSTTQNNAIMDRCDQRAGHPLDAAGLIIHDMGLAALLCLFLGFSPFS